ncbi:MAG: zinc ribbon domain-containing protein [Clostridia bacterium]|nr:zinc ribbon domain-containing protein [Clostridia bacterium]
MKDRMEKWKRRGESPPLDAHEMTPGYTLCPDCGTALQQGVCPECGKKWEPPPLPPWWPAGLCTCLAGLTAAWFFFMEKSLLNLGIAFAGACAAVLVGCAVWFWAAFKFGLDKRLLLRAMLFAAGAFLLDLTAIAVLAAAG